MEVHMVQANRPANIIAILKSVGTEYPADMRATLAAYISELETRQSARPAHITAILRAIDPDHPGGRGMLLETYISALEANQRTIQPDKQARFRDLNSNTGIVSNVQNSAAIMS